MYYRPIKVALAIYVMCLGLHHLAGLESEFVTLSAGCFLGTLFSAWQHYKRGKPIL